MEWITELSALIVRHIAQVNVSHIQQDTEEVHDGSVRLTILLVLTLNLIHLFQHTPQTSYLRRNTATIPTHQTTQRTAVQGARHGHTFACQIGIDPQIIPTRDTIRVSGVRLVHCRATRGREFTGDQNRRCWREAIQQSLQGSRRRRHSLRLHAWRLFGHACHQLAWGQTTVLQGCTRSRVWYRWRSCSRRFFWWNSRK